MATQIYIKKVEALLESEDFKKMELKIKRKGLNKSLYLRQLILKDLKEE